MVRRAGETEPNASWMAQVETTSGIACRGRLQEVSAASANQRHRGSPSVDASRLSKLYQLSTGAPLVVLPPMVQRLGALYAGLYWDRL